MNDGTRHNKFVHRTESLMLCDFSFAMEISHAAQGY